MCGLRLHLKQSCPTVSLHCGWPGIIVQAETKVAAVSPYLFCSDLVGVPEVRPPSDMPSLYEMETPL